MEGYISPAWLARSSKEEEGNLCRYVVRFCAANAFVWLFCHLDQTARAPTGTYKRLLVQITTGNN